MYFFFITHPHSVTLPPLTLFEAEVRHSVDGALLLLHEGVQSLQELLFLAAARRASLASATRHAPQLAAAQTWGGTSGSGGDAGGGGLAEGSTSHLQALERGAC